ncbi:recombinase family protein [Saccharothrix sp. ALI-22-I]|uniref:recombinase family protein n=1 Tax=Saccharothrix sp. ALI-22-I TaxID=1933778 RepID=UPI00117B952B|nr:recombinase family protein [Saccharothrix sp. ALI-22-I]
MSEAWQREMAEHTIAGRGVIVAGFFDVGVTARVSWSDRPRASVLLAASGVPGRGFDAVVVGDYERAFGSVAEFKELVLLFEDRGVPVWMPEAGGLVSVNGPDFAALLTVLQSVVHSPAVRGVGAGRRRLGRQGGGRVRP